MNSGSFTECSDFCGEFLDVFGDVPDSSLDGIERRVDPLGLCGRDGMDESSLFLGFRFPFSDLLVSLRGFSDAKLDTWEMDEFCRCDGFDPGVSWLSGRFWDTIATSTKLFGGLW